MDERWSGTVTITAPVERVYAYLADFPKHCEWAQTLERMELKKQGNAAGVGAVYTTHERQAMQSDRTPRGPMPAKAFKGTTQCEVKELLPNRRIAWRSHPVPISMGIHADLAFDLTPTSSGDTIATQSIAIHQPWLPYQMFMRFAFKLKPDQMKERAKAQWQASLDNVKTILEEPAA